MLLIEVTINGTVNYLSMEGIELTRWWDNKVISFTAPNYTIKDTYGGYVDVEFGNIEFSPDLFLSPNWPPPAECPIVVKYTDTDEASAEVLFDGTCYIRKINRESIVYDIFDEAFDINLLDTAVDYNGDTVPLPRAFGTVTFVNPVRLPDAGGFPIWHKGNIQGVLGTNYFCYDDGIDVSVNFTDLGTTLQQNVGLAGELTLSGVGLETTLDQVMSWGAITKLGLAYDNSVGRVVSPPINYWAAGQDKIISFLSDICLFFTHLNYIRNNTLYLVDMFQDNGTRTITEFEFFPAEYDYEVPIRIIKSAWENRFSVSETIGQYVKHVPDKTERTTAFPYGNLMEVTPFDDIKSNIEAALDNILLVHPKPRARVSLPLLGSLPVPGEAITLEDTSLAEDTDVVIRCRKITYDFNNDEVVVEGEGTLT